MMELKKEIESLLFSSGKMMKEKELAELTAHSEQEVKEALESLKKDYDERDTSLVLMNSGDNWKLNVREKYMGLVTKIVADTELPFPVLETLGIIAFKAPAMQVDIIKARGTNAYEQIGILVEQEFVEKRKEGRSFRLSLTPKFFEYFEVADHEAVKEVLKDVKVPEQKPAQAVGSLEVVDLPPKAQKNEEEAAEGEKKMIGDMEVVDVPPEEPKETIDTNQPDNDFLDDIDKRIEELSKRNDENAEDNSFKRTSEMLKELGLEGLEGLGEEKPEAEKKESEEGEESSKSEKTEEVKEDEEEGGEDEEGDEEDSEEEESPAGVADSVGTTKITK